MNQGPDLPSRGARLLIVDDSADNREIMEVMLQWEGFVTLTASTGEEGLACAAEYQPDLMLLDFVLPGLSGCEVVTRMKSDLSTKDIPILILSGMSDSASRTRALSAGAADFLMKPIARSALCERVRNILGLKAAAAGVA